MNDPDVLTDMPAPASGFDPFTSAVRHDPYPYYHWLLREDPVHRGAHDMWYVSRYDDVAFVMKDDRFGRAGFLRHWSEVLGPGPLQDILTLTVFFRDPPDHTRLRAMIARAFSARVVRALEPRIDGIVDDLLREPLERGTMDVIRDFAYPLPLTVVSQLLGIPVADREQFRDWSVAIGPMIDTEVGADLLHAGHTAMGEFADYMRELFPHRRRHPGDDLLSAMLQVGDEGTASEDEIICMAISLVLAGHETTTNLIGNGLLALLRRPAQMAQLRDDPSLITSAVEECLRFDSPVQQNTREVQQDTELRGKPLRRGELVVALQGAANRDPDRFVAPDTFDVRRDESSPMSFGIGRHFCLGASLARLEGRLALEALLHRLPGLELTVADADLTYLPSSLFRGVTSLPVSFEPSPA